MIADFAHGNENVPVVARATVTSNNDPDKLGRVQVEYPWYGGDACHLHSEWARICLPYASNGHGFWFLPEVGDEVLVSFEKGNLDTPIVVGSLYSPKRKPAESGQPGDLNADNKNSLNYIKTKTGHSIEFNDSDGNSGIKIKDKDNRRLEINSKDNQITLTDAEDNQLVIKGSEITVKNKDGSEIAMKGQDIKIKGKKIEVKGETVAVKGAQKVELADGAASNLLKGKEFLEIFNSHTHTNAGGTTTTPTPPLTPAQLSQKVFTG